MSAVREENGMLNLDANQIIRTTADVLSDGQIVQKVIAVGGNLVPKVYDEIVVTYVSPSSTDVATATYKLNGVTVAVLSLVYDGSNRLINVVRS